MIESDWVYEVWKFIIIQVGILYLMLQLLLDEYIRK